MIDAEVQSTPDGAIVFDRGLGLPPAPSWFEPSPTVAVGGAGTVRGGRGGVSFLELGGIPCVLRHYRRGGLMARLSADRYLWTGEARTRSFREFRLLVELANADLPVPAPVAARYVREGATYRADLITRRIQPARTLAELLAAGLLDAGLGERVGATLARFHAHGAWHADLNAHNILLDGAGVVWVLDFDRGRLRASAAGWQQANLARLRRSLRKLGADGVEFEAGFWQPLRAAHAEGLGSGAELETDG